MGTNPLDVDSNNNGIPDGDEDFDGDGLRNLDESRIYGTDPLPAAALTDETWEEVKAAADVWVAATPGMFEVLRRLLEAASA